MRVPEALDKLEQLRKSTRYADVFRYEAEKILDLVWFTAYQEGDVRLFSPPQDTKKI